MFNFRKSSYSGGESGTCVEVARNVPHVHAIRDSKDQSGPILTFNPSVLATFVNAVKAGTYDH